MIKGNTMDTFTILFDNGEKFALVAPNRTGALMLAHELNPNGKIIGALRLDEWAEAND
jgi:hypothetical protein